MQSRDHPISYINAPRPARWGFALSSRQTLLLPPAGTSVQAQLNGQQAGDRKDQ
jgi:hypothetical protein